MADLEDLAEHLREITSAWQLDVGLVREGIADACKRIRKLEDALKKEAKTK